MWRMTTKKRNGLSKKASCTSVHVKREKNRRAISTPAPDGFRLPIRFVSAIASFFFLLLADAVLCQLSSTVDPFGFEGFRGNRNPIAFAGLFTGEWFPSHIRRHVGLEMPGYSSRCFFLSKENKNVWPFDPTDRIDRCLLPHPTATHVGREKTETRVQQRSIQQDDTRWPISNGLKLFCRAN